MVAKTLELEGTKQGRLTVIRKTGTKTKAGYDYLCGCYCGNLVIYNTGQLRHKQNARKSCGCCRDDIKYPKEYSIYTSMLQRCRNSTNSRYSSYGGRGIEVCNRWRYDFLFFLEDMSLCPSSAHSLERINVDGNYEPANCKWALPQEQNLNKRKVFYYEDIAREITRVIEESERTKKPIREVASEYINKCTQLRQLNKI